MNTDNINKTIAVLKEVSRLERTHGRLFDMNDWGRDLPITGSWLQASISCNTAGCIAGWACVACDTGLPPFVPDMDPFVPEEDILGLATEYLELPDDLALDLFTPEISEKHFPGIPFTYAEDLYRLITAEDAINVLEILRGTGEVRWKEVLRRGEVLDDEDEEDG